MSGVVSPHQYRPEIDGLRAIAVLAVVLCHADLGVRGGYVGVDVFFVISGYLITRLILGEIDRGEFSLAAFWERRVRRIFPAFIVTVVSVLAAGWWLLLPQHFEELARSVRSTIVFSANWHFWQDADYFSVSSREKPLLHMWSLAVEEQFYVLAPIILLLLSVVFKVRYQKKAAITCLIVILLSLALCWVFMPGYPMAVFFLLPTRAWELLLGAFVVFVLQKCQWRSRWASELLCGAGLAAVVVSCFAYTDRTDFPGVAALFPCVGAAMFIMGSSHRQMLPLAAKLLAWRPLVFVGLISYSLYLWHWPVMAFCRYWELEPFGICWRLGWVAVSVVLAVISWRWVERPFRVKQACHRKSLFGAVAIILALVFGAGHWVVLRCGVPERLSPYAQSLLSDATDNPPWVLYPALELSDAKRLDLPCFGNTTPADVLVWGDCHSLPVAIALHPVAAGNNMSVALAWHHDTPAAGDYIPSFDNSLQEKAPEWNQHIMNYVQLHKIQHVVLAAYWDLYLNSSLSLAKRNEFVDEVAGVIRSLHESGVSVWVVADVPCHPIGARRALALQEVVGLDMSSRCATRESYQQQNLGFTQALPVWKNAGAKLIDVTDQLYDTERQCYRMSSEKAMLYIDQDHLSVAGALYLSEAFARALDWQIKD